MCVYMYMDVYSLYFSKVSYDEQKIYHMNTQVGNSVGNDNIIYRSHVRMVGIGWAGSFDQPSHVGTTTSRSAERLLFLLSDTQKSSLPLNGWWCTDRLLVTAGWLGSAQPISTSPIGSDTLVVNGSIDTLPRQYTNVPH